MEPSRHTTTHKLDKIYRRMSKIHMKPRMQSNSLSGYDFIKAYQEFTYIMKPGRKTATHNLDRIHEGMSEIFMEPKRKTATHLLDGIS